MKPAQRIRVGLVLALTTWLTTSVKSAVSPDQEAPVWFSVGEAVNEMKRPHEAKPYGVPDSYSWQAQPRIEAGNQRPHGFRAVTAWGQIFRAGGAAPVSHSVSLRNLRMYVVLPSGKLQLIQTSSSLDGAQFNPDYRGNANTVAKIIRDADEKTTVMTDPFSAFHFWPSSGRVDFEFDTVRGIVVAIEAKINTDEGQSAEKVNHSLILSVGADYWLSLDSPWDNYRTNIGVGIGRFRYIGTDWECFTMTTLSKREILALPGRLPC
jgi:hypothetical protein